MVFTLSSYLTRIGVDPQNTSLTPSVDTLKKIMNVSDPCHVSSAPTTWSFFTPINSSPNPPPNYPLTLSHPNSPPITPIDSKGAHEEHIL